MEHLKLEDVDVDGAIRETAAEAMDALDGDTRSSFLRRAGLAGGAVMGGGALLGALAPSAMAAFSTGNRPPSSFGKGDIGVLNYALTLEYLESTFYSEAVSNQHKAAFLTDNQARAFLAKVAKDEADHVKLLKKALGKHAIKKPKFDFKGTNASQDSFLATSFAFENLGVAAYSGQAFNIKDPKYLAVALSIVTVEGRHAAAVGLIRNGTGYGISPDGAVDKAAGASAVLKAVGKTGFIQS